MLSRAWRRAPDLARMAAVVRSATRSSALTSVALPVLAAGAFLACAQPEAAPSPSAASDTAASERRGAVAADAKAASQGDDPQAGGACGEHGVPGAAADSCGSNVAAADGAADSCGAQRAEVAAPTLRRVAAEQVCMKSNRFQGKAQISTEVAGQAYFGCCSGCARQLAESAAARTASDPVTGEPVDKASAIIGARPDGSVVYFASEESFLRGGGA
jgi:YHS domain-containing protein